MSRLVPQSSKGFPNSAAREACSRSTNIPGPNMEIRRRLLCDILDATQGSSLGSSTEMAGTKNLEFTCTCAVATITS